MVGVKGSVRPIKWGEKQKQADSIKNIFSATLTSDFKVQIPFGTKPLKPYFCTPFRKSNGLLRRNVRLTHGVMVALQILVLSVKVRILMGQQKSL